MTRRPQVRNVSGRLGSQIPRRYCYRKIFHYRCDRGHVLSIRFDMRYTFALFALAVFLVGCDDLSDPQGHLDLEIHGAGAVFIDSLGVGSSGFRELALYPEPDSGYVFDRWEGAAFGHDSPLIVPLAGTVRISAFFAPVPTPVVFDGIPFVLVPEGEFRMGSEFDFGDDRERPVHDVVISRPFYMSVHEVTQQQWRALVGNNPSPIQGDDRPVTGVSWFDVQTFLNALNTRSAAGLYRLPTEAEWEYACRAGTTTMFYHGDDLVRLEDYAWYFENWDTAGGYHVVGQRRPNRFGLYDMLGNAWEWVQDAYDPTYYAISPTIDPQGPSAPTFGRVIRGGSNTGSEWTRCSARAGEFPEVQADDIGFRIVRMIQ